MSFLQRVQQLPRLGLGVSTEYGAGDVAGALDPQALRDHNPRYGGFLEVGVELARGLDRHARAWAARGQPTTYHFLDINLDEPADFDARWLDGVRATIAALQPAWLCGDAGMWHVGRRDRGHMLLLPPILVEEQIGPMAEGIARLREATGLEVLPENPPGAAFVGDLHILDFFGRLAEAADTGLLLDCAHLALFQRMRGLDPLTALDGFPLDRVVELHVAGGTESEHAGLPWVDDDHGVDVLPETWRIVEHVAARAPNLKAVVVECERNALPAALPLFSETDRRLRAAQRDGGAPGQPAALPGPTGPAAPDTAEPRDVHALQHAMARMLYDPAFVTRVYAGATPGLTEAERRLLTQVDRRAWGTDPYRRGRGVHALLEEFPVTGAILGLPAVDAFFSSDAFAAVLTGRGSLALAFGDWAAQAGGGPALLEAAIARARRAEARPGAGICTRPGVEPVGLPPATLERYGRLRAALGPDPVASLAEGRRAPRSRKSKRGKRRQGTEWLVVQRDAAGEVQVGGGSASLARLLEGCAAPRPRAAVAASAQALGCTPTEAEALVDELLAEGLLVHIPSASTASG